MTWAAMLDKTVSIKILCEILTSSDIMPSPMPIPANSERESGRKLNLELSPALVPSQPCALEHLTLLSESFPV